MFELAVTLFVMWAFSKVFECLETDEKRREHEKWAKMVSENPDILDVLL